MRGSWRTGRRIAMSCVSAERRGSRLRSAWCYGPSSNALVPGGRRGSGAPTRSSSPHSVAQAKAKHISLAHLRCFAALGGSRPNALFFAGDLGQRIFQQPFSWKAIGVDIRGRSRTLRVNYRTSHQIRTQADRLLGPVVTDVNGNIEDRSDTVSVFNGPPPIIRSVKSESEEIKT